MASVEKSVVVDCDTRTTYNQWTQFESFPSFMENVERVTQLGDRRLHWVAEIGGKREEWDAEIVRQEPDRVISWRSLSGPENSGTVMFEPVGNDQTKVTLQMSYEPQGILEKAGAAIGLDESGVERDLDHFKEFIESRGEETGEWRGRVAS
jgi:uncharacterized membrane protein